MANVKDQNVFTSQMEIFTISRFAIIEEMAFDENHNVQSTFPPSSKIICTERLYWYANRW